MDDLISLSKINSSFEREHMQIKIQVIECKYMTNVVFHFQE